MLNGCGWPRLLVEQTAGRVPVVIGVSGISTAASVLYTRHAAQIGADAVIAMPPYVKHPPASEIPDFYAAVAHAGRGLPVWIQNNLGPVGTPMSAELLTRMLRDIPGVSFIKEESENAPQVISQVQAMAQHDLKGIMGGMGGRFVLEEYRRGACGTMPASEVADALVLVWNALEEGDEARARRLHTQLLPMLNYEALYTYAIYKEVLVKRGVIASSHSRVPGAPVLDAENHREIDVLLQEIEPLLTLGLHRRSTSNVSRASSVRATHASPSTSRRHDQSDSVGAKLVFARMESPFASTLGLSPVSPETGPPKTNSRAAVLWAPHVVGDACVARTDGASRDVRQTQRIWHIKQGEVKLRPYDGDDKRLVDLA